MRVACAGRVWRCGQLVDCESEGGLTWTCDAGLPRIEKHHFLPTLLQYDFATTDWQRGDMMKLYEQQVAQRAAEALTEVPW